MIPDFEKFEPLRRLLALKRYEHPPADYFKGFSSQVIARIQAGEKAEDPVATGRLFWDTPWLQRLWAAFETKPILAGAVGVACCALLLASVVLFDGNTDTNTSLEAPQVVEASLGFTDRSSRGSFFEPAALADFQLTNSFGGASSQGSLFPVQPVNFIRGN